MEDRKFEIRCNAKPDGELQVRTGSLSVSIGQTIVRNGVEEMWQSVLILCEQREDGFLSAKIIVSHQTGIRDCKLPRFNQAAVVRVRRKCWS